MHSPKAWVSVKKPQKDMHLDGCVSEFESQSCHWLTL